MPDTMGMIQRASTFVPADLDATRIDAVEALAKSLACRPVKSAKELEVWLLDRSDLDAACSEARANLYIDMTCDTQDAAARDAYLAFVENVQPRLTALGFDLDTRQTELMKAYPLDAGRYGVLERSVRADVELFREENIPIQTALDRLAQRYDEINAAMMVAFDGREQTLPQMSRYLEVTDRGVREKAWRVVAERRAQDRDALHAIYEEMVPLRTRQARNAGFDSYVSFAFKSKHRFDYGPDECRAFHDGVARAIMPLTRALDEQRRKNLGVDRLRPWDFSVDEHGREPLRPFEGGRELVAKSVAAMRSLDPRLATMLSELGDGGNTSGAKTGACLDLDSRKGKAPGGYQYMRDRSQKNFIFMNAAGTQRDVTTMVHEAGHAFHSRLCHHEPLLAYRHSPTEFAEVASMSMEMLSMRHWDARGSFYEGRAEDQARAAREQIQRSIALLPWVATIDAFQLWVYDHPTHTREERTQAWLDLDARFGSGADWSGLEDVRAAMWQRQLHLFTHPMYYIEYGIAMLGSLQLWVRSLEEGETTAIDAYLKALSLGGSKPLPELFKAAGLVFDFGYDTMSRLAARVTKELEKVPG